MASCDFVSGWLETASQAAAPALAALVACVCAEGVEDRDKERDVVLKELILLWNL